MNPVIIVPTYVSARRRREGGSLLSTYDHMTSLSQQGELPRLLRSLVDVEGVGQIIVLVVTEPSIEAQAAEKIQKMFSQEGYEVSQRLPPQGKDWNEYLQQRNTIRERGR